MFWKPRASSSSQSQSLSTASPKKSLMSSVSAQDLCENCGLKQKWVENGHTHPYCGRRCALEYKRSSQISSLNQYPSQYQSQNGWSKTSSSSECSVQGCRNPARTQFAGFCSDSHARHAMRKNYVDRCSQCGNMPATSGDLCMSCQRYQKITSLKELNNRDIQFKSVALTFADAWNPPSRNKQAPQVLKILAVELSRKEKNTYEGYRKFLEKRSRPSEMTTFHSSQCICDLGTRPNQQPCEYPSCGICCVIRSNFTKFIFGETRNVGSLGHGIYSYINSYKADEHATSCTSSPYRVSVMCSVLLDKTHTARSNVKGDTVYLADADAIVPTHLVLYASE